MLPVWLKVKGLKEPLAHIGREPSSCFSDTLEKKETAAFRFLCKPAPVSARDAVTAPRCCMKLGCAPVSGVLGAPLSKSRHRG